MLVKIQKNGVRIWFRGSHLGWNSQKKFVPPPLHTYVGDSWWIQTVRFYICIWSTRTYSKRSINKINISLSHLLPGTDYGPNAVKWLALGTRHSRQSEIMPQQICLPIEYSEHHSNFQPKVPKNRNYKPMHKTICYTARSGKLQQSKHVELHTSSSNF